MAAPRRPAAATIRTERLELRGVTAADGPAMHACLGDAEAMRFWDSPPNRSVAETTRQMARAAKAAPLRRAVWAITRSEDAAVIGMINYHHREPAHRRMELGWIMAPAFWRHGYMTEAARGVIRHCIARLHVHRFEALIEPGNRASRGLAERLGFRCESAALRGRLRVGEEFRDCLLYGLLAEDFAA